jgi:DNA-binding LacI/PurR family transcriptional regulator
VTPLAEGSPLVSGAAQALAHRIRSGDLLPGRGLPSERKLSEELSVSRVVVRAAIQELERQGLVACKPRCRPIVCNPRQLASVTKEKSTRYIAVWLWPSAGDFCAASILRGVQGVALPNNVKLVVANAVGDDIATRLDSEAKFLRGLAEDGEAAGAIVWYLGGATNEPALQKAAEAGVPMVFLDRLPPSSVQADFVGTDNSGAARRAVEHLISLGHRRIALLSNADKVSSVLAREAGYRRALNEARIDFKPEHAFEVQTDEIESVADAIDRMLSLPEPPTAVFGINDHVALQAHEALTSRGVSIPDQMSVLGFDGLLRWVPGGGYLSSAWQDFERIGQTATELIIERMDSHSNSFKHILFDAPVRSSASTARYLTARPETTTQPRDFTEEVLS